jgi:putative SOS response-associated peptidase YedK
VQRSRCGGGPGTVSGMCGRYTSTTSADDLAAWFAADLAVADRPPRYNVAPTDEVYAVAEHDRRRRVGLLRWGLVPPWAESPRVGSRMINARAETLLDKDVFRRPLERRRCLVPADGFYEWTTRAGGGKQAWHLRPRDGGVLAFAGLWESWRPRGGDGERVVSATIVTTAANATVTPVHDRMPVCLPAAAWGEWLDPANDDLLGLTPLLVPAPEDLLEVRPVGPAVGNVANDGPELLAEV